MPLAFLLSLQAAGMVFDYMGTKYQSQLIKMGAQVQQAGQEANIQQTRLEAEDASLQSLIKLRKTLGTQLAVFAARGTNPGAGSAFTLINESLGNFKSDERMRRLNLLGRETEIKGKGTIARLNEAAEVSKLWQGFGQRTINRISSSAEAYGKAFAMGGA